MRVILRPSSHPQLDPIVVTGILFAIGRQEPPFNTLDGKLVSKLSRRHARLFEEGGSVYLADLGSLNGTSWNGEAVKQVPVALRTGDVVEFGGLAFEAEVTVDQPEAPVSAEVVQRLVLTPERLLDTLEPIVVSSFPFLFDKSSEVFARHKDELREVLAYMSRHHAHIFLRDGELFVEDLGSTNGTFVAGRKLDERARQLKDGDIIALGSDRLAYSVHLIRETDSGTTQMPSGIEAVDNPTRTIFVDSPTSFLDVYFVADAAGASDAEPSSRNGAGPRGGERSNGDSRLLVQLSRSFFDGPVFGRTARRTVAGGLLAAGAVAGIWYWQGRDLRAIEAAMAQEHYGVAVALAQRYLEARPDDAEIRSLATRGAVLQWVPPWATLMEQDRFDMASASMKEAAATVGDNADAARVMQLLDWSAQVRSLLAGAPPGADISALMTRAQLVSNRLDWWQSDSWTHARTLDRITETLPEFRDAREQIYSDVRQLRSEGLDYRPLIDLDRRLTAALAADREGAASSADDLTNAARLVDEFVEANPQFPDRGALAQDLDRLRRLRQHIAAERWLEAVQMQEQDPFVTATFAEHGRRLADQTLPDADALASFRNAAELWRQGELDAAVATLSRLGTGEWRNLGQERLNRYRALLDGYRRLQGSTGEADYADALFAYYGTLRDAEDGFLLAQLEQEFQGHADAAVEQAAGYLAEAQAAWSAYRAGGGIQPEHRMQQRVSTEFIALSSRLTDAAEALRRSQRIHRQVNRALPEGWAELDEQIYREVAFQRGQVANLAFHEPEVRRRMLSLLPEPL